MQIHKLGTIPEGLDSDMIQAVQEAWVAIGQAYSSPKLQTEIYERLQELYWVQRNDIEQNVALSELGLPDSKAEIDIVIMPRLPCRLMSLQSPLRSRCLVHNCYNPNIMCGRCSLAKVGVTASRAVPAIDLPHHEEDRDGAQETQAGQNQSDGNRAWPGSNGYASGKGR